MDSSNIIGAKRSTAAGGVSAVAIYLVVIGARTPEVMGDYVILAISVAVFLLGALLPDRFGDRQ